MITISHAQAQRYLLKSQDSFISSDEWVLLHQHLITCPECRMARSQAGRMEEQLRRSFHRRWDGTFRPESGVAGAVLRVYATRVRRRDRFTGLLACLGVFVLAVFVLGFDKHQASQARVMPVMTAQPTITPEPAALPDGFPEIVVYSYPVDGSLDLFLLNPGDEPLNLTRNTGEDAYPAWSPDGNWLAFLSDRSGKMELYRLSMVTLHLEQLTHESGVVWLGPPAWSPDGTWIVLLGRQGGEIEDITTSGSVYLIEPGHEGAPVEVMRLENSQQAVSPRFSPDGKWLLFLRAGQVQQPAIFNPAAGQMMWVDLPRWVQLGEILNWSALEWLGGMPGNVYVY